MPPSFPHDFVLDFLDPLPIRVKKMFGNTAIYAGEKIYLATRQNPKNPVDDGIWVGTAEEHHASLIKEFPELTSLTTYRIKKWLLLPDTLDDFEHIAERICLAILAEDPRLGVIPPPRKARKNKNKA